MYLEEFTVGQEFLVSPFPITREQIIAFAKDYDPLPLHLNEEYAKQTRFGGLIASGVMSSMLIWAGLIREHDPFGAQLVAGKSNHMTWSKPVYPGDMLRGTSTVLRVERRNSHNGILELSTIAYNQDDEPVLESIGEIIIMRKGRLS